MTAFFKTRFFKMNGLGNEFVVIDTRAQAVRLGADRVRALADRTSGVGFDQLILIAPVPSGRADAAMRIFNADGAEVESCGNAARCVAAMLLTERAASRVAIDSLGGRMEAWWADRAGGAVAIDMGVPRFEPEAIPLAPGIADALKVDLAEPDLARYGPASCVNVGNPHAVFFVEDADAVELVTVGPRIEHHGAFPQRVNVSFVSLVGREEARARVWERGAGATRACGTAACAIGALGAKLGLTADRVTVQLPGGPLGIDVSSGRIVMTGDWAYEWTGALTPDGFSREASQERLTQFPQALRMPGR